MDLSSPGEASVNDRINPNDFTLHYVTTDHIIRMVSCKGALLVKFAMEVAYQNIAVHPHDRFLLGMCPVPYIFNSVADPVQWILVNNNYCCYCCNIKFCNYHQIPDLLHFLDDFITVGPLDPPL